MWPNPQFPPDLVTFTEEIPNGKLDFLCSVIAKFHAYRVSFDMITFLNSYVKDRKQDVKQHR